MFWCCVWVCVFVSVGVLMSVGRMGPATVLGGCFLFTTMFRLLGAGFHYPGGGGSIEPPKTGGGGF